MTATAIQCPPVSAGTLRCAEAIRNWVPTHSGRVRAVCQWCDKRSKPVEPTDDGRPGFWDLRGWSESPYRSPISTAMDHTDPCSPASPATGSDASASAPVSGHCSPPHRRVQQRWLPANPCTP
jgi:hypothetical protein